MDRLTQQHRAELERSGLTVETIDGQPFFSSVDRARATLKIGDAIQESFSRVGEREYLLIECRDSHGNVSGYRVKPPRAIDGRKYLQPLNTESYAFFSSPIENGARAPFVTIVEGEKKALAVAQTMNAPAIGLIGAWNWQRRREKGLRRKDRHLIPDLADVDWRGRRAVICFDTDDTVKSGVRHAAAELARVLTNDHGAIVAICWLPACYGEKTAPDDFLFEHGPDALRDHLVAAAAGLHTVSLGNRRAEIVKRRRNSAETESVYLDRSGVGSGKTHADLDLAVQKDDATLVIAPSHDQCAEIVKMFGEHGVPAVKYPALTNRNIPELNVYPTCQNFREAKGAMDIGLSPAAAVCPSCVYLNDCTYRTETEEASQAKFSVGTHERGKLVLDTMLKNRRLFVIQEQSFDLLAPVIRTYASFNAVKNIISVVRDVSAHDSADYWLAFRSLQFIDMLENVRDSEYEGLLELPDPIEVSRGFQARFWKYSRIMNKPRKETVQIVLAAMTGAIESLAVESYKRPQAKKVARGFVAIARTDIPPNTLTWISDASTTAQQIQSIVSRPVVDATPPEHVENIHRVLQIPIDFTKSASPNRGLALLRACMVLCGDRRRLGLITHRHLTQCVTDDPSERDKTQEPLIRLEPELRARFTRISHFWATDTRGSNQWIEDCDALIVLGTPRQGVESVRTRLMQLGMYDALEVDGRWMGGKAEDSADYGWFWSGLTESGRRRTIRGMNYGDHRWRQAFESITLAELEQAVGRARSIMETGIPAIVCSTVELAGATLVDEDPERIDSTDFKMLAAIKDKPLRDDEFEFIGRQKANPRLKKLERAGLVRKLLQRQGWILTEMASHLF